MPPNSVCTDAWVRIAIDIVDVGLVAQIALLSVAWISCVQYNKAICQKGNGLWRLSGSISERSFLAVGITVVLMGVNGCVVG